MGKGNYASVHKDFEDMKATFHVFYISVLGKDEW
jgi:hypothetical protein